jgi:hypothetical protein
VIPDIRSASHLSAAGFSAQLTRLSFTTYLKDPKEAGDGHATIKPTVVIASFTSTLERNIVSVQRE